ncbi:metalloprotease TIKI1 isoform X2 [Delphinapterus leucas]|uniref:Metalloprotease TIKI1 isoform X2 n=1 Tax=Delphinapterus leucas TaxID=9749 RepID=A0A7F8KIE8_DELLE|nr:metalloprotease TIKI1 isoform X2 [Delphinapterus leucas]
MMPSWMTPDQHGGQAAEETDGSSGEGGRAMQSVEWAELLTGHLCFKPDPPAAGEPVSGQPLIKHYNCGDLSSIIFSHDSSQRKDQKPVVTAHPLCRLGSGSARPGSSGTGSWVCRAPTVAAPPASAQKFLPAGRGTTKVPEEAEAAAAEAAALAVQRPVSPTGGEIRETLIAFRSWKHLCRNGLVQPLRFAGSMVTTECALAEMPSGWIRAPGPRSGQAHLRRAAAPSPWAVSPQSDGGQQCLPVCLDTYVMGAGAGFPNRDNPPVMTREAKT